MAEETIADRVRWLMETCGMSAREFGSTVGLSSGAISFALGRGAEWQPKTATLAKISKALDVDFVWLMLGGKRPDEKSVSNRACRMAWARWTGDAS